MAVAIQDAIKRLRYVYTSEGADKVAADMNKVGSAQAQVASTAQTTERATLSLEKQFASLERRYNQTLRAQQDYERVQRQVNAAVAANPALQERANQVLALAAQHFNAARAANDNFTKSAGLARHELVNLSRQVQDIGVSLASGQSPFTVLVQQGTQVGDIFSNSQGTLRGFAAQVASVITPMRVLGVGMAAVGAVAIAAAVSWRNFALQLDDTAKVAGIASSEMAKLQAAASFKGIGQDEFSKAMGTFSQHVYEARNNMGSLGELLRANGQRAGEFSASLEKVADLVQRANGDVAKQFAILQQAGLPATMEWVRLLSQGAEGLRRATNEAAAFGGKANDELVAKARQFDEAWNKAWTNFGLYARNAFVTAATAMEDPKVKLLMQVASGANPLLGIIGAGSNVASGLIGGSRVSGGFEAVNTGYQNPALAAALNRRAAAGPAGGAVTDPAALRQQIALEQQRIGILGQLATVDDQVRGKQLEINAARLSGVTITKQQEEAILRLARAQADGTLQMRAMTDQLETEAAVIGKSVGAATEYRLVQERVNEARRLGVAVSAETQAAWEKEAKAAGDAAQALEKARVAAQIKFDRQTAFLSQEDVQIAQQLRGIYGDDVPAALASSEAAAMRFNNAIREVRDTAADFAKSFVQGLMAGKSVSDSLSNSLKSLSVRLADKAIENLLSGDFSKAAIAGISAVATYISSTFFGNNAEKLKQQMDAADRAQQFKIATIQNQPDSLANRLHLFDEQANQQRVEEERKGNQARKELEEKLFLERLQIQYDFDAETIARDKATAAERLRIEEQVNQRRATLADRLLAATTDTSTLEGQLALFDRKAQREREDEIRAGGEAMAELEAAQAAERLNIQKAFQDKSVEEAKRAAQEKLDIETRAARGIVDYLNSLQVGPESSLSPQQRLTAAQSTYNSILALAQQGNADALGRITSDFENLRKAAQAFYGSSAGYQNILSTGITQLTNLPGVASSTNDVVAAVRDVVTAVNATTTAASQTKAAVDADKIATTDKLSEAIGNLATVINRLDQSLDKLTNNNASLDAIETFSNRIINAFNGLGQLTASFARSNHDENNIIMDKLQKIPNNSGTSSGGGQTFWDWLGFAGGGTLPAGRIGIMGEHHPDGPFVVQAGANPIPITPAMPSFANDNGAILDAILAEQRATRRVLAAVGAALVNAEHQSGREVAESVREAMGDLAQSQARDARQDRMRKQSAA